MNKNIYHLLWLIVSCICFYAGMAYSGNSSEKLFELKQALIVKDSLVRQDSALVRKLLVNGLQAVGDTTSPELKLAQARNK